MKTKRLRGALHEEINRGLKFAHSYSARIVSTLGSLFAIALFVAPPAWSAYEQVNTFEQKSAASALAVNISGAGGVPAGTLYAANSGSILRYSAKAEPLGEWNASGRGVAVHQSTGNVYVLSEASEGKDSISVYNADGSQLVTSFGEQGVFTETVDESPEKIHGSQSSGIAVDSSGTVYVSDVAGGAGGTRVMVFKPQSPGDYEHYVYTGQSNDIVVGTYPRTLALDSANNLYIASEPKIYEFASGKPATPICEFQRLSGGIEGITVNPNNGEVFYFTYKTKKIHQLAPCDAQGKLVETISFAPTPKATDINGLAFNPTLAWEPSRPPSILYAAGAESGALGYIFAPAEVKLPVVESQSASLVTSTTAALSAQVNPKGSETRYVFQYLTEAVYEANEPTERFAGAAEAPPGGADLGAGQIGLPASASLVGLQPDTEYRYRVIATSHCDPEKEEVCEDTGSAQAFRTFPLEAPGLSDNRAWELISPAQKNSGQVIPAYPQQASCQECKPAVFGARGFPMQSAPDGEAIVYEGFPFSTSEGAAIFNQYISHRTPSGWQTTILSPRLHRGAYRAFDAELTQGLFVQGGLALSPDAPPSYYNLYTQPTASPSALTPLMTAQPPNRNPEFTYAGASADFSRLFFEANDALTGETPFAPPALDPGAPTAESQPKNLYEWANGELSLVNVLPGNSESALSATFGSGEFLTNTANTPHSDFSHAISEDGSRAFWSDKAGQVYVRENGEVTIAIPDPGKFLTASADGSKVLLSNGHIYDLETEETTDLTEGEGDFQGIAGQIEDLSRIYFVDTAVLTGEEENNQGGKAQSGEYNLYAWEEGAITFIATLLSQDNPDGDGAVGTWNASPSRRSAEASRNGRWLAFRSEAPLTGYDNVGLCGSKGSLAPCREVFLYDSASGELTCPSCNPSGTRSLGRSTLRVIQDAEGSLPQPRYLLDSGRLYFDTQDSLTPFDTNRGVEDVYQYEPQGVGSCKREGGCVSLISAGREPIDSNFLAVDETGKNVFFTSRDRLVKKDFDDLIDLYVAREGGGIPEEIETECQGEACQPAAIAPNDSTPASSSFEGPGNLGQGPKNPRCAKGKVRRRGRCIQKRHNKRSHRRAAKRNRGGAR